MRKEQLLNLRIKNIVKSFLDEDLTPIEIRVQAAKGLIPLETKELVTAFYYFLFDGSEEVKSAAKESIDMLPERMLTTYLSLDIPPAVLDYFAKSLTGKNDYIQPIVLNKNTSTDTLKYVAISADENIAVMIADNQEKIMKDPDIINSLARNSKVHVSLIERLRSFMVTIAAPVKPAVMSGEMAMHAFLEEEKAIQEGVSPKIEIEETKEEEVDYSKPQIELPPDEMLEKYSEDEIEKMRQNTWQRIQTMSVAEKIQEALKGTREARSILIKDSNKLITSAVVKSPKITEDEVVKISCSKSVSDEVLRLICQKDEWLRNYNIKLNLVNNPKTPFPTAVKFLGALHKKDLINLSKSKMVPGQIALMAKKMAEKKQ